jgi:transcriptional regulator with XRE-family HTH domain
LGGVAVKLRDDFAQYLKSCREKVNLTQAEVAEKLGYSTPQFISNWERAISVPPLRSLKTLAKVYQLDVDQLFETILQMSVTTTEQSLRNEFRKVKKHS